MNHTCSSKKCQSGRTDLAYAVFVILLWGQGWEEFSPTFAGQQYHFKSIYCPRISLCSSFMQNSYQPNMEKYIRGWSNPRYFMNRWCINPQSDLNTTERVNYTNISHNFGSTLLSELMNRSSGTWKRKICNRLITLERWMRKINKMLLTLQVYISCNLSRVLFFPRILYQCLQIQLSL